MNDGVEESPPSKPSFHSSNAVPSFSSNDLFADLNDANVSFKHWHPMPVIQNGNKLGGQSDMGGLWEWTSSVLEKQEGFAPMKLYPGYSGKLFSVLPVFVAALMILDDFYDGKHNVVLGGSWATLPRIAGRKTL